MNRNILDFATKQRKILPCQPHKIILASERCSCVQALMVHVVYNDIYERQPYMMVDIEDNPT